MSAAEVYAYPFATVAVAAGLSPTVPCRWHARVIKAMLTLGNNAARLRISKCRTSNRQKREADSGARENPLHTSLKR